MVNYYNRFVKYVKENDLKGQKMPLDEFESKIMVLFGIGDSKGRHRTLTHWVESFEHVGYIKMEKEPMDTKWYITIL